MASIISVGTTSGTALNFSGDTSGNLQLTTQAGANVISVPNVTGTLVATVGGGAITSGTAVATTSGTSIDFTGIPSWVKRVTVMLNGVSTNGLTPFLAIQLGAGSIATSGYIAGQTYTLISGTTAGGASTTTYFPIQFGAATYALSGALVFNLLTSNLWAVEGVVYNPVTAPYICQVAGVVGLGGTLDRVRLTTSNGTDTFDAGSVNILYEG